MSSEIELSVVIVLDEESPDFVQYVEAIYDFFQRRGTIFEMLIIANGLEEYLKSQISHLVDKSWIVKAFAFPRRVSPAVCVRAALKESRAGVLLMCGSYPQIPVDALSELLDAFTGDVDLVCPWRRHRVDPKFNQLQSRFFNALLSAVTKRRFHDLSCTTRVLRREVLEEVRLYGNMYRFLPVLAANKGFRVREVVCAHSQERGKTGFYSFFDYMERLLDIANLFFNTRFSRKPLRFFSAIGTGLLVAGFVIFSWGFIQRLLSDKAIGNNPVWLAAVLLMVTGVATAGLGLLGEIIAFAHGRQVKEYTIEKIIL